MWDLACRSARRRSAFQRRIRGWGRASTRPDFVNLIAAAPGRAARTTTITGANFVIELLLYEIVIFFLWGMKLVGFVFYGCDNRAVNLFVIEILLIEFLINILQFMQNKFY